MENPFVLAVALLESREVTIRFLAGARENEPDSPVAREKPIDWRLLVDATVPAEIAQRSDSNAAAEGCNSEQAQYADTMNCERRRQLVQRTLRLVSPLAKGRPRKRGALQKKDGSEGGRKECSADVTRGSCA